MEKTKFKASKLLRLTAMVVIIFSIALSVSTSISTPATSSSDDLELSLLTVNVAQAENLCDERYNAGWYYQEFGCCAWSTGIMCAYYCSCF